jgi:hypothetical protein
LIYLAVQLRQNTRSLKSATIDSLNSSMAENARILAENREMAELLIKADSGEALARMDHRLG